MIPLTRIGWAIVWKTLVSRGGTEAQSFRADVVALPPPLGWDAVSRKSFLARRARGRGRAPAIDQARRAPRAPGVIELSCDPTYPCSPRVPAGIVGSPAPRTSLPRGVSRPAHRLPPVLLRNPLRSLRLSVTSARNAFPNDGSPEQTQKWRPRDSAPSAPLRETTKTFPAAATPGSPSLISPPYRNLSGAASSSPPVRSIERVAARVGANPAPDAVVAVTGVGVHANIIGMDQGQEGQRARRVRHGRHGGPVGMDRHDPVDRRSHRRTTVRMGAILGVPSSPYGKGGWG